MVAAGRPNYCFMVVAKTGLQAKTSLQMGQIRMMLGPDVCCAGAKIVAMDH